MPELDSTRQGQAASLAGAVAKTAQTVLVCVVVVLLLANLPALNGFVRRALSHATELDVGELKVLIGAEGEEPHRENWVASYRVSRGLRIEQAGFSGDSSDEFIDVTATEPINLSGGFIGDSNELLSLGDQELRLDTAERLRIYTFRPNAGSSPSAPAGMRYTLARKVKGKLPEKGIYKHKLGKGDRLVIVGANSQILVDVDFWWTAARRGP